MLKRLACAVLLGLCALQPARADGTAGAFDYYVLSLSWSPTYCASDEGRDDHRQCGGNRRYDFVVHGLWPQYESGWPDYCPTDARYVPERIVEGMLDIMPSRSLVIHEWRRHGTCSGLSQEDYFATTRRLFERLAIPARYVTPTRAIETTPAGLEHDFVATNTWLDASMISVHCGNRRDTGRLREVRLCFSRDFEPRPCGENERRDCRADVLVLPPVR